MNTEFGKNFAGQLRALVEKANNEPDFRDEFLRDPQQILQTQGIPCPKNLLVEYHPGYGVYVAIDPAPNADLAAPAGSGFNDSHLMDCHQH